eukprot:TRINITY_DN6133_c0_g1_i2.p1 TRINITY_DN6133_c0_g1~~TRINITY_DN6133_c0_g1_i2.p1  ORF type:complete len:175 (+),score=30.39 TRINITY_DN6133_c0_g1_i2:64-588(+)
MCIRDRYMGVFNQMEIQKSLSQQVASSSHQYESVVIPVHVQDLWPHLRNLAFDKLSPKTIKKTEFSLGEPGKVGSQFKWHYTDGAVWEFKILEISDLHYFVTFEAISADPPTQATSIMSTIHLRRVTEDNTTFLTYTTDFSNDADANLIQDLKYKKLDYFKEFKENAPKLEKLK